MSQSSDQSKSGLDRRKFLRNSLLTGLGAGLTPLALPGINPRSDELKDVD